MGHLNNDDMARHCVTERQNWYRNGKRGGKKLAKNVRFGHDPISFNMLTTDSYGLGGVLMVFRML